tara:strand:- start:632 stop:1747 length:1116 start_codon:yes stop_codon:yes gene_type:complete
MATTYLTIVNNTLTKINEPTLTSSTFASDRGIQTLVKNVANDIIYEISQSEIEWPFNRNAGTQTLTPGTPTYALPTGYTSVDWESFVIQPIERVTNGEFTSAITSWTDISAGSGTAAYTSDGDGRARLTGDGTDIGGISQSLTTVKNRQYRLFCRFLTGTLTVYIGTTSGGTEIATETLTLTNTGEGPLHDFTFTATGAATFISFVNTSTTTMDIDFVRVREDEEAKKLIYTPKQAWSDMREANDALLMKNRHQYPDFVYPTQNDRFGITPPPLQENWEVEFDYWAPQTALSAHGDTISIPDEFAHVIIDGMMSRALELRSDPVFRDRADKRYRQGIEVMRRTLISRPTHLYALSPVRDRGFFTNLGRDGI